MYKEFYLKNLKNYLFTPNLIDAIPHKGISVLSRDKNIFRVIVNQRYKLSITHTVEFDSTYKLKRIVPKADNQTTINILFSISSFCMNSALNKLSTYTFDETNKEETLNFVIELISCQIEFDRLHSTIKYISASSKIPEASLLEVYLNHLILYYLYNQLLETCENILKDNTNSELRQVVFDAILNLGPEYDEILSPRHAQKIDNLFKKITDEEILSILKDKNRAFFLTYFPKYTSKIDSLSNRTDLITLEELIKILPTSYFNEMTSKDSLSYLSLKILLLKNSKDFVENYLNSHLQKSKNIKKLFENRTLIDLICENSFYEPILYGIKTYLNESRYYAQNAAYKSSLDLLHYIITKYDDSKGIIFKNVNRLMPVNFKAIFNCISDYDTDSDRERIYGMSTTLLSFCPAHLLSKIIIKVSAFDEDYVSDLLYYCSNYPKLQTLLFKALINTDYSFDDLLSKESFISIDTITKTPLITLIEESGKLDKFGIKKVDL